MQSYKEDDWEDEMDGLVQRSTDNTQKTVASMATLAMFIATYFLFKNSSLADNMKVVGRQNARRTTHNIVEDKSTPWGFSPEGFVEGNLVNAIMDEILKDTTLGQLEKDMGITLPDEAKSMADAINNADTIGQRGYHEAAVNGELSELMYHDLGIQWYTCEDNGNCDSDNPPCDECEELRGEIFPIESFPEPPHMFCRCNEPMAQPVILNPTGNDQLYVGMPGMG